MRKARLIRRRKVFEKRRARSLSPLSLSGNKKKKKRERKILEHMHADVMLYARKQEPESAHTHLVVSPLVGWRLRRAGRVLELLRGHFLEPISRTVAFQAELAGGTACWTRNG